VTEAEMLTLQPEVRDYEPRLALSGLPGATGDTGDALHRRLIASAPAFLAPGGWLLLEVGHGQAQGVMDFARAQGYHAVDALPDLSGILRVVQARWNGVPAQPMLHS